jgi:16S rRNA C967 or C1407 C5-methylase (RsmB/RsmF family)
LAICSALEAYTRRLKLRGAPPFAYRVDCYDVDARRLRHLRASAERAGVAHRVDADVARAALEKIVAAGGAYDAVLVDAPCSSSGALRRFPSLRWQMDEAATRRLPLAGDDARRDGDGERGGGGGGDDDDDAFKTLFEEEGRLFSFDSDADADVDGDVVANETSSSGRSRVPVEETDPTTNDPTTPIGGLVAGSWPTTQRLLLARGAALCRPDGGALIYATCSMLETENQDVARWFERRFDGGGGEDAPLPKATGSERGGVFGSFAFAPDPFPPGWPSPISPEGARGGDASHEAALNPVDHGTDGFYVARWRRRPRGAPRGGAG